MATFDETAAGQTVLGSDRVPSCVAVNASGASALVLKDSAGVEWAFWVQSNVLTFGTRAQWLAQSGGSAV